MNVLCEANGWVVGRNSASGKSDYLSNSDTATHTNRGIAQLVEQRSPKPRAEGSSPSAPAIGKSPKPQQLQGFRGFSFLPKKLKMQQNVPNNYSKSGTNLVHAWGNRGEFRRRKNGCKPSNTNGLQSSLFSPAGGTRGEKARKTLKKPVWIPIYTIF